METISDDFLLGIKRVETSHLICLPKISCYCNNEACPSVKLRLFLLLQTKVTICLNCHFI